MKGLEKSALSVSAVSFFLSQIIKDQLGPLVIRGEISNLRTSISSYFHFSLKDYSAKIECLVPSSTRAGQILENLQNGDEVFVIAQAIYYSKYGKVSFFAKEIFKIGRGELGLSSELLKNKLLKEGVLSKNDRQTWSPYPEKIGIITSKNGAALQDILRVARDRYPLVTLYIFPSLVQGGLAKEKLYEALSLSFEYHKTYPLDALIIARGGGDSEDLDAFNDENLVRLISQSKIPIITAIGHETDKTLADYASDFSAPTPTGAAMVLFPEKDDILSDVKQKQIHIENLFKHRYELEKNNIRSQKNQLNLLYKKQLQSHQEDICSLALKLESINPKKILDQGYAFIEEKDLCEKNIINIQTKTMHIKAKILSIEEK